MRTLILVPAVMILGLSGAKSAAAETIPVAESEAAPDDDKVTPFKK